MTCPQTHLCDGSGNKKRVNSGRPWAAPGGFVLNREPPPASTLTGTFEDAVPAGSSRPLNTPPAPSPESCALALPGPLFGGLPRGRPDRQAVAPRPTRSALRARHD